MGGLCCPERTDLNSETPTDHKSTIYAEEEEIRRSIMHLPEGIYGSYEDLDDEWFQNYLKSIRHALELLEYWRESDENQEDEN